MPTLDIVLGTYNRYELLKACLESLIGKINTSHKIYVIDAGSTDSTLKYLKSLAEDKINNLILIEEGQKLGQAKSLNNVFKSLDSDFILWLSDDNFVIKGMIDEAVSILEDNEEIGMVALKVKDISGEFSMARYIGGINKAGILNVNQGMIRKSLLEKIEYFDENFKDYGIDSDLTTKVLLEKFKVVYTKDVAIYHNRNHAEFPGAIDNISRKERQLKLKKMYADKYPGLMKKSISHLIKKYFYKLILKWYFYYFEKLFGYYERDWRNVFESKYISIFDFMRNSNESFYLVQSIEERK